MPSAGTAPSLYNLIPSLDMIFLDRPYVSDFLLNSLSRSGRAVLRTAFTEELARKTARPLLLVNDAEAEERCRSGERLYSNSENALDWMLAHLGDLPLAQSIRIMKDKAALRRILGQLDPGFFFREIPAAELPSTDISAWPCPFILKPSVGFLSMGVHTITNAEDWKRALEPVTRDAGLNHFPDSVVNQSCFIAEQYITGDEYAVDLYFDEQGAPVILNIFQHRFASFEDVSDRLYVTGEAVIRANLPRFTEWFSKANALIGARNFPAHAELRVDGEHIRPIEFNPMRFAGLCTTDMAAFAFGLNTVETWLNGSRPDFDTLLAGREGKTCSMIILDKPRGLPENAVFDYKKLVSSFQHILELRKIDVPELPLFGIIFAETDERHRNELDRILKSDLTEFLL